MTEDKQPKTDQVKQGKDPISECSDSARNKTNRDGS